MCKKKEKDIYPIALPKIISSLINHLQIKYCSKAWMVFFIIALTQTCYTPFFLLPLLLYAWYLYFYFFAILGSLCNYLKPTVHVVWLIIPQWALQCFYFHPFFFLSFFLSSIFIFNDDSWFYMNDNETMMINKSVYLYLFLLCLFVCFLFIRNCKKF